MQYRMPEAQTRRKLQKLPVLSMKSCKNCAYANDIDIYVKCTNEKHIIEKIGKQQEYTLEKHFYRCKYYKKFGRGSK
jgi:hypothetical protein